MENFDITVRDDSHPFDDDGPTTCSTALGKRDDDNQVRWNAGERFHHLFEEIVDGLGDRKAKKAVAVEYPGETISFADLEAMSNQLARYFIMQGVKPGQRVAVLFDRTVHAYATLLAISKVGAVFVPLDTSFPVDRIQFILEDSGASLIVTLSVYTTQFKGIDLPLLALDAIEDGCARHSSKRLSSLQHELEEDALAYIIYTSGTTGRPKGVQIVHSSIVNFLRVARDAYGFEADDRVYQSLTLAFDYSFEEIWVPLLSLARLVPAPTGVSLLGADLAEFFIVNKITACCTVPTVLATIECDLPDLRLLITSGESCPSALAKKWFKRGRRILNLYGPTETTVTATWTVLEEGGNVTIGKPLPSYTTMILDPDEPRVLAHGEVGELAIAGIGVSPGYINRPEETKKAFIEDFIGIENNPTGKIYRSGDLARFNDAGEIEYMGRKDTQVKIRGYRIELGEIEEAANDAVGMAGIVVNPVEAEESQIELAAYYVQPIEGAALDLVALNDRLRKCLPPFMVPSYYEELEAMPLLPSGKIDRSKLPKPSKTRLTDMGHRFVEPDEGMEVDLAACLAKVLKAEKISAEADFFNDLGANSLVMARYLALVRKDLGLTAASMRLIYQNSTIASLAAALAPIATPKTKEGTTDVGKSKTSFSEHSPLTPDIAQAPESHPGRLHRPAGSAGEGAASLAKKPAELPQYIAPRTQHILCSVYQVTYLAFSAFMMALIIVVGFSYLSAATDVLDLYRRAVEISAAVFVGTSTLLILVKWVAIGRFVEERIPLWSGRYARFWIAQTAIRSNPLNLFIGTPLYNVYLRLLGAKVGKGALIFSPAPICTDLISIGEKALIRQDCQMPGYTVHRGYVHTGSITVGDRAYIAEATALDINASVGNDAQLGTTSALMPGQHLPNGKIYQGCPAVETKTNFIRVPALNLKSWRAPAYTGMQLIYTALIGSPLPIVLVYLLLTLGFSIDQLATGASIASVGIVGLMAYGTLIFLGGILLELARVVTMPKIYNRFFKPEKAHPLFGFQYFIAQRLTATSNSALLQALFGDSSMIMPYYRALGYDLSEATQTGSNFGVQQRQHSPFLCKFSRNTLVADGLSLLNMDISATSFKLSPIEMPADTYLGNDLHYPVGAKVGKNCLIATKAFVPIDGPVRENTGLLGSPAFEIPRSVTRDSQFDHYKKSGIFERRLKMKLKSNVVTLGLYMFRNWSSLVLTTMAVYTIFSMFAAEIATSSLVTATIITTSILGMMFLLPMYYILFGWAANLYAPMKPRICSIYERPFWDHERFWKLNINDLLAVFDGTPLKPVYTRMQGVKLGRQVFDNGAGIAEPYMVEIGDYACLNTGSTLQGHSLEDGTFKSDRIKIGDRSTIGLQAFVHYGVVIGDDAIVATDAFAMKGSIIGNGEIWRGNPAEDVTEAQANAAEPTELYCK